MIIDHKVQVAVEAIRASNASLNEVNEKAL